MCRSDCGGGAREYACQDGCGGGGCCCVACGGGGGSSVGCDGHRRDGGDRDRDRSRRRSFRPTLQKQSAQQCDDERTKKKNAHSYGGCSGHVVCQGGMSAGCRNVGDHGGTICLGLCDLNRPKNRIVFNLLDYRRAEAVSLAYRRSK